MATHNTPLGLVKIKFTPDNRTHAHDDSGCCPFLSHCEEIHRAAIENILRYPTVRERSLAFTIGHHLTFFSLGAFVALPTP